MIDPDCYICGKELEQAGALYFGPPAIHNGVFCNHCEKRHICLECDKWLDAIMRIRKEHWR